MSTKHYPYLRPMKTERQYSYHESYGLNENNLFTTGDVVFTSYLVVFSHSKIPLLKMQT